MESAIRMDSVALPLLLPSVLVSILSRSYGPEPTSDKTTDLLALIPLLAHKLELLSDPHHVLVWCLILLEHHTDMIYLPCQIFAEAVKKVSESTSNFAVDISNS